MKRLKKLSKKEINARKMIEAVKAGDWQAYSKWQQHCQLENALVNIANEKMPE